MELLGLLSKVVKENLTTKKILLEYPESTVKKLVDKFSKQTDETEEYDGSAWTAGGNMGTGRRELAGAGTQTAALGFGGDPSPNATEEYDGTSWTAGGNMGTGRGQLAGAGTQTAGLAFGSGLSELYDGSAWTNGGNMINWNLFLAGAGTQTAGLAFGGYNGTNIGQTEEYEGPGPVVKTLTTSQIVKHQYDYTKRIKRYKSTILSL